jgi:hypothetical protein
MTGYLRTLAVRALQQPPSIRPRVASLFESPGPRLRPPEPIGKRHVVQPRRASETGNEHVEPLRLIENNVGRDNARPPSSPDIGPAGCDVARRVTHLQPERTPISDQAPHPPVRAAARESDANGERTRGDQPADISDHNEDRAHPAAIQSESARAEPPPAIEIIEETHVIAAGPERGVPALMPTANRPRRDLPLHAGVIVRPERAASEGKAPALEAPPPSRDVRPSIRITIGRVDVRAIMPQPATMAHDVRKAATPGPMSLDAYLKKRDGA